MNSGPWKNSSLRRPVSGSSSMMSVPMMSDGIRSGVNWIRRKSISSVLASVLAMSVLPRPGTPSIRTCPRQSMPIKQVVEDRVLPDDHAADLGLQPVAGLPQAPHGLGVVAVGVGRRRGGGW